MFSENALRVLEKRYFQRDSSGAVIEDVAKLLRRVADAVAQSETKFGSPAQEISRQADLFFDCMFQQKFLPNSPTLMNAGKPKGQLSACFVLPVPDSLEGIFETCKNAALIHKTGGGTGFSFSRLRPANDLVATSAGVASGPVSFMGVYDAATEAIRQGGTRRGANMGILRVDHPDIEEFIACKRDTSRLNNFNISVAATDEFMQSVEKDTDFALIHPRTGETVRRVRARYLFDKLVENAHATGEPGLIFLDRINALDPLITTLDQNGQVIPGTEDIEATNPCGEQPLGPGDACNLGSINLANLLNANSDDFDWSALDQTIQLSVRFLDDVIEANSYPLPFIAEATRNNRRIGLGVMGWAESLIRLGIPYNSEAAVSKAEQLMSFFQEKAHQASAQLAAVRGCFPNWEHSTWKQKNMPMRNATVTTIAPTGTISILAGTTSGIEPLFAISYVRRVLGGIELIETNPLFEETAKQRSFYSEELMQLIAEEGGVANASQVPKDLRELWVSAHDISYEWHVRMQVAFQKNTDNAVSKTINFPNQASLEQVKEAYLAAFRMGLKGITVYRDGSRVTQVLNISKTDPLKQADEKSLVEARARWGLLKKVDSAAPPGTVTSPPNPSSQSLNKVIELSKSSKSIRSTTARDTQTSPDPIKRIYDDHSACPECGTSKGSQVHAESCMLCVSCGYTKC